MKTTTTTKTTMTTKTQKTNTTKATNENVTTNGNRQLVRFVTKQDILWLHEYEKMTGYKFNALPNEQYIKSLADNERMPVAGAIIHNGIEMQVFVTENRGSMIRIDMPFNKFFSLRVMDVATGKVVKVKKPKCIPSEPPRKGIDIQYYVSASRLEVLDLNNRAELVGCDDEYEDGDTDVSIAELLENTNVTELPVSDASISGLNEIRIRVGYDGELAGRIIDVTMSADDFFQLHNKIAVWDGWN